MTDRHFDPVVDAFNHSVAGRLLHASSERLRRDWRTSLIVRAAAARMAALAAAAPEQQLRLAATILAVAAVAHLGTRLWLPRYATSGLPWWWNAVLAAFAAGVALRSRAIAGAWPASTPARIWRRFAA